MTNKYEMITVNEFLNTVENNTKDSETMISIEKYLTEVVFNNESSFVELLAEC